MADLAAWAQALQGTGALATAAVAGMAVIYTQRTSERSMATQREQNKEALENQREQTKRALELQERIGRAALLWDRRIGAYERVMSWLVPTLQALEAESSVPRSAEDSQKPAQAPWSFPTELDVQMRLFASGEVLFAVADLLTPITSSEEAARLLRQLEAAIRFDIDRGGYRAVP